MALSKRPSIGVKFAALVVFFAALSVAHPCPAWTGTVVAVPEANVLVLLRDGQEKRIRLYGVECPERGQPFQDKAQGLVEFLTKDRTLDVNPLCMGIAGDEKCLVRIEGTRDYLNEQLVAYGLAWVVPNECVSHMCSEWKKIQKLARSKRLGLWADPRPIPPWEWRRVQWKVILENKKARPESKAGK